MDQNIPPNWMMETRREPDPHATAVRIWMREDLKRRYDDALREPLPRDLIDLVNTRFAG